jgi:hypothetical protein
MDLAEADAPEPVQVVDPEIRAYVYSLVTAVSIRHLESMQIMAR